MPARTGAEVTPAVTACVLGMATSEGRVPASERALTEVVGAPVSDARPDADALAGIEVPAVARVHATAKPTRVGLASHDGVPDVARVGGRPSRPLAPTPAIIVPVDVRPASAAGPSGRAVGGAKAAPAWHPCASVLLRRGANPATAVPYQPVEHHA